MPRRRRRLGARRRIQRGHHRVPDHLVLDHTSTSCSPAAPRRLRRKTCGYCNGLQGFLVYTVVGGGTGPGLGCLMPERLSVDYGKKSKSSFTVWSCSRFSTSVEEPYNTVLCVHALLKHTDVTIMHDNVTLYELLRRNSGIERPTRTSLNDCSARLSRR